MDNETKMKVKIIREFKNKWGFGEFEYIPYQVAFGVSIRHLKCAGMGWMFRVYFGVHKVWFNLRGSNVNM